MRLRRGFRQTALVCFVFGAVTLMLSGPSSSRDTEPSPITVAKLATEPGPAVKPDPTPEIKPEPKVEEAPAPVAVPQESLERVAAPQEPLERVAALQGPSERVVRVRRGDTLMILLVKAGVPRTEAHDAITALRSVYNPRHLMPDQEIVLELAPESADGKDPRLLSIRLQADYDRYAAAVRGDDGAFHSKEIQKRLERRLTRAGRVIDSSLLEASNEAGLPREVMLQMIRAFSYDVDFQRDIQPGDAFEVLFERLYDKDGRLVHNGDILYAALTLSGTRVQIYRHTPQDADTDYFNEKGESVRKSLMRTPVNGARLSSRYGRRRHPILGYTRMHQGLDFAAPRGAPIMAAGSGIIDYAGRHGAYGNYIRIRHNSVYATAYAHLDHFAKGIRSGKRVKQGQVVGYVGSTGLSTGPHLHYEVMRNGRRINPLNVKLPAGRKLKGHELATFRTTAAKIDRILAGLPLQTRLASKN